jgi:hypothetical protein
MEVGAALLADAARVESGKLYIHGGGWDTIYSGVFPFNYPTLALAVCLLVEWGEAPAQIPVSVDLIDEDETVLQEGPPASLPVIHAPISIHGSQISVTWTVTLQGMRFDRPGNYRFRIKVNDKVRRELRFQVVRTPGPSAPTP